MGWHDRTEVKKGDLGEQIVAQWLLDRGIVPYHSLADKAHPFDFLCASQDKKTIYIVEVKAKSKRECYEDTGIEYHHYMDYTNIREKYGIQVYLFFVDEKLGEIYGNKLSILEQPKIVNGNSYPWVHKNKYGKTQIYFPLASMQREIAMLTDENIQGLLDLTSK